MTATVRPPALQSLMTLADRYARKLVAQSATPVGVLLIERAGALDIVMLERGHGDAAVTTRQLLSQYQATSAALMIEAPSQEQGLAERVFCILGESIDGVTDERHYRLRSCGRGRRLTALTDGPNQEVEGWFRPLFAVHAAPLAADAARSDAAGVGGRGHDA